MDSGRLLALVTGASSGIGRELARVTAREGHDLVIVARRAERLDELAVELSGRGAEVTPVAVDLADPAGVPTVMAAVKERPVDVLVNDAGVGGRGRFAVERDLETDLAMIALNVSALVQLTGLLLPGMVARGRGRILNVASIAGYLPGPRQAVYNATKAFVRSFSQALSEETRETGVSVTVLCPGPVRTEFARTAGFAEEEVTENPLMRILPAARVAEAGWAGLMTGRTEVVPDVGTRIGLQMLRFLPWRLVARTAGPAQRAPRAGERR